MENYPSRNEARTNLSASRINKTNSYINKGKKGKKLTGVQLKQFLCELKDFKSTIIRVGNSIKDSLPADPLVAESSTSINGISSTLSDEDQLKVILSSTLKPRNICLDSNDVMINVLFVCDV